MNNNLIMLIMGSKYPVAGKSTRGLRFGIGDANPSTLLERMMNNHLFSIIDFFSHCFLVIASHFGAIWLIGSYANYIA